MKGAWRVRRGSGGTPRQGRKWRSNRLGRFRIVASSRSEEDWPQANQLGWSGDQGSLAVSGPGLRAAPRIERILECSVYLWIAEYKPIRTLWSLIQPNSALATELESSTQPIMHTAHLQSASESPYGWRCAVRFISGPFRPLTVLDSLGRGQHCGVPCQRDRADACQRPAVQRGSRIERNGLIRHDGALEYRRRSQGR